MDTDTNWATTEPKRQRLSWRWLRWLRLPLVAWLAVILLLTIFENWLIYFPSVYPAGYWDRVNLEYEDAHFEAADGTKLHGWYVRHNNPRALLLFAHGNAGNISHRAQIVADMVARLHVNVLIFDYRGYGRSQGSPSEPGILADARAARRWLAGRAEVPEQEIVLFGESLGGGVMVDLAAQDGARGLILHNTFSSLPEVGAYHYRWLPVRWFMRTRMDSAAKVVHYRGPLIQIHGGSDTIVPMPIGRQLFENANEPKRWVTIAGGDHNDPPTPEFFDEIDLFLKDLTVGASGGGKPIQR